MKKLLAILLLVTFMAGCATTTSESDGDITSTPESITRQPSFGQDSSATVGQAIYTYQKTGIKFTNTGNGKTANLTPDIKYEILYSGYSQGTLRASYREFANDLARPAFSQEGIYDFAPGTPSLITFKGAQIEVLDANNNEIRYRVIKGVEGEETDQGTK